MKYAIAITVILLACWKSYAFGVDTQAAREAQAREELIQNHKAEINRTQAQKQKIEVKYRDRIKTVYKLPDPTGCLDTTLGDIGLYKPSNH
jgi:hypothetical protein